MTHYHVDDRDMMFNLKECPGFQELQKIEHFEDVDEDTIDMLFDQSKAFCTKVLAPILAESDKAGSRLEDGKVVLPESIGQAWEQYKELGLIGMCSDSNYGGGDMPHFISVPMAEMECGSFVAFSMLPLLTRGAARLIWAFGNDALKDTYLENMFTGHWTGTMCLTEPHAGSDVGAASTKAVPEGDHYRITGTKIFISWGDHEFAENIIHLVLARTPGSPAGTKGLSLFVVPKRLVDGDGNPADLNFVECGNIEHKMGIKASPTCVLNFDGSKGFLVGEEGRGMRYMFQMMNEARIEVGVQGMGLAAAAYESARLYALERVQGSLKDGDSVRPAKIVEHEDVRRMLLKMRAIVQGLRSMTYHLMYYVDMAAHHPDGEKYQALVELMTPILKSYGSDQGFRVTELAVQTYGGYGYCQEYPAEQYLRDCKISSIYEGANGIQALDLVFRKILMNQGAYLKIWMGEVMGACANCKDSPLEPLAASLQAGAQSIGETATWFGKMYASGKDDLVRFHATDFQEAMGHIMVGYFLLLQAITAQKALQGSPNDADKTFYEQKLVTAQYFYEVIFPTALSQLKVIRNGSASGLNASFA